jgi:tetratricopeptide (TPR) repeat protein
MSGRCYDRESVPFKALDTIIDALTSYLKSLPAAAALWLLPDDIGMLAELFPVLQRCDVVAKAPKGRLDALDQQQVRQRAFAALRLLLDRIGQQTPIVWFIDDIQWGDSDSAGAIFEVLRPPAEPHVLFLGSFRSDEADTSPFLTEWNARQQQNDVSFGDRTVNVGPLSLDVATQLVVNVVGRNDEVVRRRAVQFHAQTGGNPFLLVELAGCFDPDADAFHTTDIHGVLASKLEQLPPEAKPLLDAISVSGQSVELTEAAEAAGLTQSPEETLTRMRNVRLLRVVGNKVDTYHDRIRYAVLDRMEDGPRKAMHEQLAKVIERHGGGLTEQEIDGVAQGHDDSKGRKAIARVYDLAFHYDAAGNQRRALAYAFVAAEQARGQCAHDVAAQQFAIAKRNADAAPKSVRFRIGRGLGEALILLGRYDEAAKEIEVAAILAESRIDIADAGGVKAELASKLGLIAESIEHYEASLRTLGIYIPRTRIGYCWGICKESLIQVMHSLFPGRLHRCSPNPECDLANHLLARMEWSLYAHNVLKLIWASFVGLNRAERLPRSKALVINYIAQANDMAVLGWNSRAERYYRMAMELSVELNDQMGAALALNHFGLGCVGAGRFEEAIRKATPGKESFVKLGDLFELHNSYLQLSMSHLGLGNMREAFEHSQWLFNSCVRHQDNWIGTWAVYSLSRISRGRIALPELLCCARTLPGNSLSAACEAMAEGYWYTNFRRSADALSAFERAWKICCDNIYFAALNSCVLNELVSALRLHAESTEVTGVAESTAVRKRQFKMAKWANRLSWFLPPERPHALRELSLAYAHRGRIKKAWNLAALSCKKAEALKAKYEYAQSLLVLGQLGKQLSRSEANDQIQQAQSEIARIEKSIDDLIG